MSDVFDPYHKWLGIPPEDQPADYYRLLGLKRFEDDPDVIDSAADQRMTHLRRYQTGQHAEDSQRLLNEVAAARLCLLNAEKRAAYDAQFAEPEKPAEPAASVPPTPPADGAASLLDDLPLAPQPAVAAQPLPMAAAPTARVPAALAAPPSSPRRRRPPWAWPLILAGGALAVMLCLIVAVASWSTQDDGTDGNSGPVAQADTAGLDAASPATTDAGGAPPAVDGDGPSEPPVVESGSDANTANDDSAGDDSAGHGSTGDDSAIPDTHAGSPQAPVVEVARMQLVPLGDNPAMPDEIRGGSIWKPNIRRTNINNGLLEFTVKRGGTVYLVTSTQYEGNRSGGWFQERMTPQKLVAAGWQNLGPCPWRPKETLLRRVVEAGQSYRIRTNKYTPPTLIVPPGR